MLEDTIYLVSGIERSGTSMLMQILDGGGIPLIFDEKREVNEHNPKGYYEVGGGKIINLLQKKPRYIDRFKGKGFIKVTAYGLLFLPRGKYNIIFIERNMEEVLNSMEKMSQGENLEREEIEESLTKLLRYVKKLLAERGDMKVLYVDYNRILRNPPQEIKKIEDFLGEKFNLAGAISRVDRGLYRNKAKNDS